MITLDDYLAADPERCSHGYHRTAQTCPECPRGLRDQGIARAESAADPDDRARIDAAIREVAARGEPFSANDVRALVLDVTGPLMGARFLAAANAGHIVKVGYVQSTKASTHAHPVAQWRAVA